MSAVRGDLVVTRTGELWRVVHDDMLRDVYTLERNRRWLKGEWWVVGGEEALVLGLMALRNIGELAALPWRRRLGLLVFGPSGSVHGRWWKRRTPAEEPDAGEHDHDCCPPGECCGGPCAAHPCWELTT